MNRHRFVIEADSREDAVNSNASLIFNILIVVVGLLFGSVSHAHRGYTNLTSFPDFWVKSNGTNYTTIVGLGFEWRGQFHEHKEKFDKIRYLKIGSWNVFPTIQWKRQNGEIERILESFQENYNIGESFKYRKGPKSVTKNNLIKPFPATFVTSDVVQACETNADDLRANGLSDQEIFSKDRVLSMSVLLASHVEKDQPFIQIPYTFGGSVATIPKDYISTHKITCKKWGGTSQTGQSSDITLKNAVTDFAFNINENVTPGYCGVTLTGSITTSIKGTKVNYRFEEQSSGLKSKVYTVKTDGMNSIGDGFYAPFQHKFEVPFNESGPEIGNIRIKGNNFSFNSGWQQYSMECNPPIADNFAVELPPILSLEVKPEDNIMVDGQICPSRVRVVAGIKARSHMAGKLLFVGNQYLSSLHQFQIAMGNNKQIGDYRDISWSNGNGSSIQTEATPTAGEQPLRTKSFNVGFNIIDMDGVLKHQYAKEQFKLTCSRPQVSVHLPNSQNYTQNNAISNFWSKTKTKSTMNGETCGVTVFGGLQAIGTNTTVKLAIQNHQGFVLKNLSVSAPKTQESTFSTYIDLRSKVGNKWIQPSGGLQSGKPAKGARYSGALKLVAKSHDIADKTLEYEVLCRAGTNQGTVGGLAGSGNTQGTEQTVKLNKAIKTSVQFGSKAKELSQKSSRLQIAPNKLSSTNVVNTRVKSKIKASPKLKHVDTKLKKKPSLKLASVNNKPGKTASLKLANAKVDPRKKPSLKLANVAAKTQKKTRLKSANVATKPKNKPSLKLANVTTKPKKKPQKLAIANAKLKTVDLGVVDLKLKPNKKQGIVLVLLTLKNNGTADGSGKAVIEIRNGKGEVVKTYSEKMKIKKGKHAKLKHQFELPKARFLKATATVYAKADINSKNDVKKVRVRVRK